MSTKERDEVIVIHPPLNGEAHAIADIVQEDQVTTVILPDPATLSTQVQSPTVDAITRSAATPKNDRAVGIDAFRGFFLLLMTFAMAIPFKEGLFPQWMYHMQYPPPDQFVDRAGLTWRDLMFPGFLFTMCTAIPITNTLRLSKGMPYPGIIITALKRFAMLYVFALLIGHTLPYWTQDDTKRGNIVSIIGFLVCWPVFMRKPASWKQETFDRFKLAGWVAAAAMLFVVPQLYGSHFDITHRDDIIHALAFVSLATTTLWLFTRNNMPVRLAALGLVIALKIASDYPGPVQDLFSTLSAPAFYEPWMLELLIVAIPGTIAGDLIVKWMHHRPDERTITWSRPRLTALIAVCLGFIPIALFGFYNRQVSQTALGIAAVAAAGLVVVARPRTERERIIANLFKLAALMLVAGSLVEPVGGGIKKDPQTLSYLVFTTGTSLCFLLVAMITTDVLKVGQRATKLFVDVGQNPLIAYAAFMMFFNNIMWLTPLGGFQEKTATLALLGCLAFTALTAVLVRATTRKRVFWRA